MDPSAHAPSGSDANQRPIIEVRDVVRRFGAQTILDRVSLDIQPGEFFTLLGASGCGKTTLLRILGGLDTPDAGEARVCGMDPLAMRASERPVNTVFQSYALFPHLTVRDNVAFGLRMKRVEKSSLEPRVQRALDMAQISSLADKKPAQLSGGQKQRVAMARAVVNEPKVLLLDEPLGALDLKLRKELQIELRRLQRRLGITFVMVTHDQEEAMVLSDRIAVMNGGRIEQLDAPRGLYEHPRTRFVAQFLGSCNLLEGTPIQGERGGLGVQTALGRVWHSGLPHGADQRMALTLAIRPERVLLLGAGEPNDQTKEMHNVFSMKVEERVYAGPETHYTLSLRDFTLRLRIMNQATTNAGPAPGQMATVHLPPNNLVILQDHAGGMATI